MRKMAPEVFFTVCYGTNKPAQQLVDRHTFHPAILHGFCRRRVKNADYPGIVEDAEHVVRGNLVTGLSPQNIRVLDYFESDDYERRDVSVKLLTSVGDDQGRGNVEGEERDAFVYVYQLHGDLEEREWDFEEFRRDKLTKWTRAGLVFESQLPPELVLYLIHLRSKQLQIAILTDQRRFLARLCRQTSERAPSSEGAMQLGDEEE